MQKDIDKGKTGGQKLQQKTETDAQIDEKIARLEKTNEWFGYPAADSRMQAKGIAFRQPYQQGKIDFEIYHDENEIKNYDYYNGKIHTDFGWVRDGDGFRPTDRSKPVKEGLLYINPAYKVAIYYFRKGDGTFNVFKVRILKVTG
jgi:hypothetical protein